MNSLGSRSDRNISIKYRSCHPSYLQRLDLNTCSSSSPGLSGCISPFAKTDRLWFNANKEAETMEYDIRKATEDYFDEHEDECDSLRLKLDMESSDRFYEVMMKLKDFGKGFEYSGTQREPDGSLRIKFLNDRDPLIEL